MRIARGNGQVDGLGLTSSKELFAPTTTAAGRELGVVESHFLLSSTSYEVLPTSLIDTWHFWNVTLCHLTFDFPRLLSY